MCHHCGLPGHFIRERQLRDILNAAELVGGSSSSSRTEANGILPAPTSNAIVPYRGNQAASTSSNRYGGGSYNNGGNGYGYNSGGYNRYGGYNNKNNRYARNNFVDRGRDDKIDQLYDLFQDQVEEKKDRQRKEEERKRKEAEKEKMLLEKKDKDSFISRTGDRILHRELEDLKTKSIGDSKQEDVERLRKEKEVLLKLQEQKQLEQDIVALRAKGRKLSDDKSKEEDLDSLKKQVESTQGLQSLLEKKNEEMAKLKYANSHLEKQFVDLQQDVRSIKHAAMYTPKDMESLHKAYKDALEAKQIAIQEAEFFKERLMKKLTPVPRSKRSALARKTTPRNLRKSLGEVDVHNLDSAEDDETGEGDEQTKEAELLDRLVLKKRKELRYAKKAELETLCEEEGILYIKIEQAWMDIAEIRARREFEQIRKEMKSSFEVEDRAAAENDDDAQYATSTEDGLGADE
ncbi:hypothetical protein CBR_g52131 [Chara braunii]|uniref:Uncharacterized protein n=1 Tax=Chara braunii TaxID=69332 RepID=A0A388M9Q3_CHABU|nr:hypothetical protein CBR_g52131 [Chara braunii]|eukprot:GBG91245.1 hypothetical protein CBR_g52131 [Chara braunii]